MLQINQDAFCRPGKAEGGRVTPPFPEEECLRELEDERGATVKQFPLLRSAPVSMQQSISVERS